MENNWAHCPELYDKIIAKRTEGCGEFLIESTPTMPNPFFSTPCYLQQLERSSGQIPAHLLEGKVGSYAISAEHSRLFKRTIEEMLNETG